MEWLGVTVGAFLSRLPVLRVRRRARGSRTAAGFARQAAINDRMKRNTVNTA
jgi:hypothetical protein